MSDIDLKNIKAGDTVRVLFQTDGMRDNGISAQEFYTETYALPDSDEVYVLGCPITSPGIVVLSHTPALEWAGERFVEDRIGDVWVRFGETWCLVTETHRAMADSNKLDLERGPCSPIDPDEVWNG